MISLRFFKKHSKVITYLTALLITCTTTNNKSIAQTGKGVLQYTVSMSQPSNHFFHVELNAGGWNMDTLNFKMPQWMPGYYQIMNYAKAVENFSAKDNKGKDITAKKLNENSWQIVVAKNKTFKPTWNQGKNYTISIKTSW